MTRCRAWEKIRQISEKAGAQSGNRRALRDPGLRPAVDESKQWAIGGVKVHIFAAGFGQRGRKFGVGEGAEQRQDSAENPNREHHGRRPNRFDHVGRDQENAASDDGSDDDGDGGPQVPERGAMLG